jgi:aspartyl aminopeptidase
MKKDIKELLNFIKEAPTPYHAVAASAKRLEKAGFRELKLSEHWQLQPGGRYFVKVFDSTLLAFALGTEGGPLRIATAHTDFPCFRLKPQPEILEDGYGVLNVEKYGGMMLRTWLDRPLALAGKVALRSADPFAPQVRLVDFNRPLFTIPSLAIHMDREVNTEGKLNVQSDMLPLAAVGEDELTEDFFRDWLAAELNVEQEDILSYELSVYPYEEGSLCGVYEDFVSSPRLDNLTSVLA